jgi:hypothetical protein
MALADKKPKKIFEKSDSGDKYYLSSTKIDEISSSYADAEHLNDEAIVASTGAIMYQLQLIEEELDEIRRYVTNEATGSVINLKSIDTSALPTSSPAQKNALWIEVNAKTGAKYIRST